MEGEVFTIKYKLGEVINKYKESPFAALEGAYSALSEHLFRID